MPLLENETSTKQRKVQFSFCYYNKIFMRVVGDLTTLDFKEREDNCTPLGNTHFSPSKASYLLATIINKHNAKTLLDVAFDK